MTLRELVEAHPEWLDHELAIYAPDGSLHYVGASGLVYESDDAEEGRPALIFAGN